MSNIIETMAEKVSALKVEFLKEVEPFREELFNFCKANSATIWDAEDLAQLALLKAFTKTADIQGYNGDTKSYLLLVASNSFKKTSHKIESNEYAVAYANSFNNKNIAEMSALLSENAIYEVKGIVEEHGINTIKSGSWMHAQQVEMRSEVINYNDEYIILRHIKDKDGTEKMSGILRITVQDSKIVHIEDYFFSPEVLAHVGKELKLDYKTNGHHWAV